MAYSKSVPCKIDMLPKYAYAKKKAMSMTSKPRGLNLSTSGYKTSTLKDIMHHLLYYFC